jgi:cytochrome c oxidase cbb3-type subunit 3/ubiquinol-cytochrome c reductase cytochrome c subunit
MSDLASSVRRAAMVVTLACLIAACGGTETPSEETRIQQGQALYGRYCAFCHGDRGEGYRADHATQLANEEFLAVASDAYLRRSIERGRPGTTMSAWSKARGGPLDEADLDATVAYIRTWRRRPYASVDAERVEGDAARGKATYERVCQRCHGVDGRGGQSPQLSNPELLAVASDGFLRTSIARGRPGTLMPAYEAQLSPGEIGDVVRLLRSWQKPVDDAPATPPRPGQLTSIAVNPGGPDATFPSPIDFIPADDVKREMDRGATFVLVDARAPSDYVRGHVAGAISVPFYEVDAYAPQIPKDRYVVTYCACPHAISVQARDAFRRLGYPRAAVLDEGVSVWQERGYPMRTGASP